MAKTSTTHNPVNFDPADYEVYTYLDNQRPKYYGGPVEALEAEIKWWETEMREALGDDWRAKSHRCVHCGNGNIRWITAVTHIPTGERVVFGSDCTARLGFPDKVTFKLAMIQARAEQRAVKVKAYLARQAYLADHPEIVKALEDIEQPVHAKNTFVKDVLSKLNQYGRLSEAQAAAVVASLARDIEYAAKRAADADKPKGAAPSGRVPVTGKVLMMKWYESQYGSTKKMLLESADNYKVFVAVPRAQIDTLAVGDTVTITAKWEPKPDDPSFAFGKNPR